MIVSYEQAFVNSCDKLCNDLEPIIDAHDWIHNSKIARSIIETHEQEILRINSEFIKACKANNVALNGESAQIFMRVIKDQMEFIAKALDSISDYAGFWNDLKKK